MKNENIICIAQIDSVAGYFEYNSKKIISYIKRAEKSKASMVVFPINALSGNLIDDVIKRHPSLLSECEKWLNGINLIMQQLLCPHRYTVQTPGYSG